MHSQTLLLLVPVAMAATPRVRPAASKGFGGQSSNLVNTLAFSSCQAGYVTCEDACMPYDGVCCGDGTDEYCFEGYYCIPNACCPEGEICDGSGVGDAECAISETECDDLCMPLTGTCCNDGLHYCPDFGTCTDDGYCCDIGDDCYGSGSGSSASADLPTATGDDFSFTTATATATTTRPSTTSSFDDDDDDETTSTSTRSSTTTSTTETTSSTTTADSTTTAPPTNPIFEQAGGHFTADGRMVAGLAAAAAILL
ncbi:hypothetical protein F5X99DRAFT_394595 [Biscogniauxia marginata]|nr:hypothetical protein F5X99DRAFT_394595 [Biscogniauxia marginata]